MPELIKAELSLIPALAALRRRRVNGANWLSVLTTVVSPSPSDPNSIFDYAWTTDDRLLLAIEFSRAVDTNSVVPRSTLIVKTTKDPNADGTLTWSSDHKQVIWKSTKISGQLLFPQPDDSFTLTLLCDDVQVGGSLRRGIRDEFGYLIDGDYNGREGGTYEVSFTIIG